VYGQIRLTRKENAKVMVSHFDPTRKFGFVAEYRIVWNPDFFQPKKRIFRE
jgi:hypothetical protein